MVKQKESDKFLTNERVHLPTASQSRKCYKKWWNQEFKNQETICDVIESNYFRAVVIFLVITDTALVITEIMLDSYKINEECHHADGKLMRHHDIPKEHIETIMEIAHFSSIGILTFFVIELIVRIYASGREFWNIHRRKMEYFDAFVVITSLIIDLYYLRAEKKLEGQQLLLLFAFRLWRFIRIISSVSEGIRHGQTKHKQHLNKLYINAIHRLVELLKHKTTYLENNSQNNDENLTPVVEHFQFMDDRCQSSLDELDRNRELSSTAMIRQFIEDLNGLENRTKDTIISSLIVHPKL